MTRHLLLLAGIILPLGLDTFALAAALGVAGIPANRRGPTSLILAAFEAGMPIVGFLIGGGPPPGFGGMLEGDPAAEARAQLSEDEAERCWQEGRTMELEEALTLARRGAEA